MKELLERYASLKASIREAEAEVDEIKALLYDQIDEGVEYEIENAVITKRPGRVTWKYSDAVKELQEEEKLNGIAKEMVGAPYLDCRFKKS